MSSRNVLITPETETRTRNKHSRLKSCIPYSVHLINHQMIDRMAADSGRRKYLVHYDSGLVFKILSEDPIGRDHDNIPVYKVAWSACEHNSGGGHERRLIEDEFLSVKRVNYSDSESVFPFAKLYGEIFRKNMAGIVLPCHHKYLMPVNAYFIDRETEDLCLVMPFCELGSLRSAMSCSKFRHGLPETCISVALRCVLKALKFLYRFRHFHMNVNAGHIYLKNGPRIFLGFAATLYEHGVCDAEGSSHSSLPVTQICDWAAAPEVYSVRNDDARYRHRYTDKSDVWLVGITALELAYGTIRVPNRVALERMIKEIIRTKRLPKKLVCGGIDDNREEAHEEKNDKGKKKVEEEGRGVRNNPHQHVDSEEIRASFSREFETMVADCFTWDPWKRPTANSLLNHDFFDKNGLTRSALKSHFQDVVIQMEEDILKKMNNPPPSPLHVAAPDFSNNDDDENDNNKRYTHYSLINYLTN
ncbi:unnamed protein product [Cuscuta europaea]|uniref:Protein kinase domain-containing protein n=1 Tax=Cuscuta europaea TaxID=41803 RepID=A0A9P1A1G7_CUSEU|nr:unnamed protein product [Cuscuta europaea]